MQTQDVPRGHGDKVLGVREEEDDLEVVRVARVAAAGRASARERGVGEVQRDLQVAAAGPAGHREHGRGHHANHAHREELVGVARAAEARVGGQAVHAVAVLLVGLELMPAEGVRQLDHFLQGQEAGRRAEPVVKIGVERAGMAVRRRVTGRREAAREAVEHRDALGSSSALPALAVVID